MRLPPSCGSKLVQCCPGLPPEQRRDDLALSIRPFRLICECAGIGISRSGVVGTDRRVWGARISGGRGFLVGSEASGTSTSVLSPIAAKPSGVITRVTDLSFSSRRHSSSGFDAHCSMMKPRFSSAFIACLSTPPLACRSDGSGRTAPSGRCAAWLRIASCVSLSFAVVGMGGLPECTGTVPALAPPQARNGFRAEPRSGLFARRVSMHARVEAEVQSEFGFDLELV